MYYDTAVEKDTQPNLEKVFILNLPNWLGLFEKEALEINKDVRRILGNL